MLKRPEHFSANGAGTQAEASIDTEDKKNKEWGGEDLLDAGLRAAARGWRIFPCNSRKKPLVAWGLAATTDPVTITAWAKQFPGALWGRALPPDVLVTDLDRKKGKNGVLEFERLQGCHTDEFDAPKAVTGTGGVHVYTDTTGRDFKNNNNARVAPGIDIKTHGGFVVIPSGNGLYRWLTDPDTPMPPTPKWVEVVLRENVDLGPRAEARTFQGYSEYGNAILEGACEAIASAADGEQEHTLNSRSLIVGHYVGGGLLEYGATVEALVAAGLQMANFDKNDPWTAKNVEDKVKHAVKDGMKEPLDGEEPFRLMAEVHRKYEQNPELHKEVEELLTALDAQRDEWADAGHGQEAWGTASEGNSEAEQPQAAPSNQEARPEANWPELTPDAMHGLAGEVVRAIEPHTESDPVALLVQFITYFGNALGRYSYYVVEADRHYPNLFAVLVGQSSKSRKGTSAGRIRDVMTPADTDWERDCIGSGLSSGEGVIWRVRDPIYKMKRGKLELEDEGVLDHRLLLDEREFYQALTVMKREGNTLSRVIRDAWDRGNLQTITKHNPAKSTDAHISIIGHITEEELRQNLDHTSIMNGVANRFVFAMVRRGGLLPHGGGDLDGDVKAQLATTLRDALARARRLGRITMTDAAKAKWEEVYAQLSEDKGGLCGAACGRAEAQTIRLALIYALLDASRQIDLVHLMAGLALWDYCEQSARHIFGDLFGDRVMDTILLALRQAGKGGMTRTEIFKLFGNNQASNKISGALQRLAAHGKARPHTKVSSVGRPTETWRAM